jgi:alpha-glucosidase
MTKNVFLSLTMLFVVSCFLKAQESKVNVKTESDNLCFEVTFKGRQVSFSSPLGINIDNNRIGEKVRIQQEEVKESGQRTYIIEHKERGIYYLDIREFDDGIALRYRVPAEGARCVYNEQTAFRFPTKTKVWYASGPFQYGWIQSYQERYTDDINNELLAPPATFLLPDGTYAAITEANLFNFHGAVLYGGKNNEVRFGYADNKGLIESGKLTGMPSRYTHTEVRDYPWIVFPDTKSKEIITPWRILMLADDLNGLVNNHIIAKVANKPDPALFPQGAQTEWIKPGRSVFTWLVQDKDRLSLANHKRYVDGAAELGLQSVVVDDGWELWPQRDKDARGRTKWEILKELVEYAKSKNIDIWVWRTSSPRPGNKTDIGLLDSNERTRFMKQCAQIGVKGLKIDFLHTENLFTVNFMENILRDAAKEKLMVIFHGVNKPTGDSFTYPNLLAKEAVRGLECVGAEKSWAPGPAWPYHNTILPFTRWLAGPADYTPLNFRKAYPPSVTYTHQLATIYMFSSPMLILAADMEDMLNCPGRMFIEEVPVIWDEVRVLPQSSIGELAALAKRKDDKWYLTVLNGEASRTLKLKIDFLSQGNYLMTIASDDKVERKKIVISKKKIKAGKNIEISLLSGGGYLAKFEKL